MATNESKDEPQKMEHSLLVATDPTLSLEERKEACVQRFVDLGLGRGVDATSSKPWIEKSSFQVREVKFDLLVGTEEGGTVEVYEKSVQSVQALQIDMKSSVAVTSGSKSVKVGVDGEQTRTASSSRRVVGRKVLNRTVSFREEVEHTLISLQSPSRPNYEPSLQSTRMPNNSLSYPCSLDNCLCLWILDRLVHDFSTLCDEQVLQSIVQHNDQPYQVFMQWYKDAEQSEEASRLKNILVNLCHAFVAHFCITHYVFSIKLGAMEYSVMTERDYFQTLSKAGASEVNSIVSTKGELKCTQKHKETSQLSKKVGCISVFQDSQYSVPRGTYAEAVVESHFKPLTTLVSHPHLRRCLRTALSQYIDRQSDSSVGPFLFTALGRTGEIIYFRVIEADMSLTATTNERQASEFFVIQSKDKIYDFHILYLRSGVTHRKKTMLMFGKEKDTSVPIPHYLTTPLTMFGRNNGPLCLELNPRQSDTLFHLHSRLQFSNSPPEPIGPWVQGREAYFLNCYGRKYAKDGYLAIRCNHSVEDGFVSYLPVCVPSRKYSKDHLMIFRLMQPPSIQKHTSGFFSGGQGKIAEPPGTLQASGVPSQSLATASPGRRVVRRSPRAFSRETSLELSGLAASLQEDNV